MAPALSTFSGNFLLELTMKAALQVHHLQIKNGLEPFLTTEHGG